MLTVDYDQLELSPGDLILDTCTYATEDGRYAADCGTLVVPENRARADSRLIALPVTRIRARSEHPREPGPPVPWISSSLVAW